MSIWRFLGFGESTPREETDTGDTETVRKIIDRLDHLEPERARFVAAFAYVLSRVARADMKVTDDETATMERIVMEQGGLPEDLAIIVVQMAKSQNLLFGGTENYLVTRELNRIADKGQKIALLKCLFSVSAADRSITSAEDSTIRQIAAELQLEHKEFIEVRSDYSKHLAFMRDRGPGSAPSAT